MSYAEIESSIKRLKKVPKAERLEAAQELIRDAASRDDLGDYALGMFLNEIEDAYGYSFEQQLAKVEGMEVKA